MNLFSMFAQYMKLFTLHNFCIIKKKAKVTNEAVNVRSYNKCKGVRRHKVAKLDFEQYKAVIKTDTPKVQYGEQTVLRSFQHSIYTLHTRKLFFSSYEDKSWLLNCGVHSYSYNNVNIKLKGPYCDICGVYDDIDVEEPMQIS